MMALAGGYAYSYRNYVSRRAAKTGTFQMVISDTLRSFKEDFRLIRPKKFGFEGNSHEQDESELCEISLLARASVYCDIKVKQKPIACVIEDYL